MERPRERESTSVGVLFSGGIDSAILVGEFLRRGKRVVPLYVLTGCVWQSGELATAERFLVEIAAPNLAPLVRLWMPLGDLYADHWSMTGREVPHAGSPEHAVFLPGRNPLLLMKPALWCHLNRVQELAIGTLAGNPFADATEAFFVKFQEMLSEASGRSLDILRPFSGLTKPEVVQLGRHMPLEWTFSCLAPIGGEHCGRCNKCAERRAALAELPNGDRTRYAGSSAQTRAATSFP